MFIGPGPSEELLYCELKLPAGRMGKCSDTKSHIQIPVCAGLELIFFTLAVHGAVFWICAENGDDNSGMF